MITHSPENLHFHFHKLKMLHEHTPAPVPDEYLTPEELEIREEIERLTEEKEPPPSPKE